MTFSKYLEQAQSVYRKQKTKDAARFPLVPGAGFSVKARKAIATILSEKGAGRPSSVAFRWATLDHDEMIRLNADKQVIYVNSKFRKNLAEGGTRDAPVLKLALMFLLQDELDKAFATQKSIEWLQRVNLALIASLKAD